MKTPTNSLYRCTLLIALAVFFTLAGVSTSKAYDHDDHGYWDDNHHHHNYSYHNHHRGYWDESHGPRVFINL